MPDRPPSFSRNRVSDSTLSNSYNLPSTAAPPPASARPPRPSPMTTPYSSGSASRTPIGYDGEKPRSRTKRVPTGDLTVENLQSMADKRSASASRKGPSSLRGSNLNATLWKRAATPVADSAASSVLSAGALPTTPSFAAAALALQQEQRSPTSSALRRLIRHLEKTGSSRKYIAGLVLGSVVLVKWAIGLGGYSGRGQGPMFGDLEAQRHWMGLTVALPLKEWYFHDLQYWGLDYPPLTAYHSLIFGYLGRLINPNFVSLRPPHLATETGWGDLHGPLLTYLRSTVLLTEVLVWFPAVLFYITSLASPASSQSSVKRSFRSQLSGTVLLLIHPGVVLIDNGHFQYNTVMLGFALAAVGCFRRGWDLLGAVSFVCCLGFKQMGLYYAPAVFAYLLGKTLYLSQPQSITFFTRLAFTTILAFLLILSPFIFSSFPTTILQLLHRVFPLARGLFEDKVANFWCCLNVVWKLKAWGEVGWWAKVALGVTATGLLPSVGVVLWSSYTLGRHRDTNKASGEADVPPTIRLLPWAMFVSSLTFYLFSFQVHEKSILLPLMPLLMIMIESGEHSKDWEFGWVGAEVAVFTMYPLLKRDGLALPYVILPLFTTLYLHPSPLKHYTSLKTLPVHLALLAWHLVELFKAPPANLPDLWVVANCGIGCAVFGLGWLWGMGRLIEEAWGGEALWSDDRKYRGRVCKLEIGDGEVSFDRAKEKSFELKETTYLKLDMGKLCGWTQR